MDVSERFMRLFRGYELRHGRYTAHKNQESGKVEGRAETDDRAATLKDIKQHLDGNIGLGIIPLTSDNKAYFAAIDIDLYPMDHKALALKLADMPVYVTRSKSGGAHVWLFIKDGAPADLVVRVLKLWRGELGYGNNEIFPKQVSRSSHSDVGNWINLPYFGEDRVCVIATDPDKEIVKDLSLEEFLDSAEACAATVTEEWLRDKAPNIKSQRTGSTQDDFVDGPICLEALKTQGIGEGGRNTFMFNLAVYMKRKYENLSTVEEKCIRYNNDLGLNLPLNEVKATVKSATKSEYGYQCSEPTLASVCVRDKCLKRFCGVGSQSGDMPFEVGCFTMILTNPPHFAFNADANRVVISTSDDLLNQKKFRASVLNATKKIMPLMPQQKYDKLIQSWLDKAEEIVPPPDSDPRMRIIDAFNDWVQARRHDERDRILGGSVFWDEEDGLAYFQLKDFKRYLEQQRIEFRHQELYAYMKEQLHIEYHKTGTTIRKKTVRLYSVRIQYIDTPGEAETPIRQGRTF
jgi:hypothetical protein